MFQSERRLERLFTAPDLKLDLRAVAGSQGLADAFLPGLRAGLTVHGGLSPANQGRDCRGRDSADYGATRRGGLLATLAHGQDQEHSPPHSFMKIGELGEDQGEVEMRGDKVTFCRIYGRRASSPQGSSHSSGT